MVAELQREKEENTARPHRLKYFGRTTSDETAESKAVKRKRR